MNATSAACCDDEDDEDGEAADMEGIDRVFLWFGCAPRSALTLCCLFRI